MNDARRQSRAARGRTAEASRLVALVGWLVASRRRRASAAGVLAALTALATALATRLDTRFEPEALVDADPAVRADVAAIEARFGAGRETIVVVLDARPIGLSLLEDGSLADLHVLARALGALDGVIEVEGITTSRIPREQETERNLDDLEDLTARPDDPRDAWLMTIVSVDPARFPSGMLSLRGAPVTLAPIGGEGPLPQGAASLIRTALAQSPSLRRRLVSDDERVAVLAVAARDANDPALLGRIRETVASSALAERGCDIMLTGLPVMRREMREALERDRGVLALAATLGTLLVLLLGMRSLAGVLAPLASVGIAVALTLGGMAAAGLPMDLLTNMLPPLLVAIGISDAMHMVLRHGEELALDGDPVEASRRMFAHTARPCFVTSATTAIGFAALLASDAPALRTFGAVAALAAALGLGVTFAFVPVACASLEVHHSRTRPQLLERWVGALTERLTRRARGTLVLVALATAGLVVVARLVSVESRLLDQFPRDSALARASALLEDELDGFRTLEVVLEGPPGRFATVSGIDAVERVAARARASPHVLRVTSAADWLRETLGRLTGSENGSRGPFASDAQIEALLALVDDADAARLRGYVTAERDAARIEVRVRDAGAAHVLALAHELRAAAGTGEGLRMRLGGEAYVTSTGLLRITGSLAGLVVAALAIFAVVAASFRSCRLGAIAVPPTLVPVAVTLAYMAVRGIPVHAASVMVFAVTLGLGIDGTTHVIARFGDELRASGDARDSTSAMVVRSLVGAGRGVALSSVVLVVGYAALLASRFEPVRIFGELATVSILAALCAQLTLLPALLVLFGRKERGGELISRGGRGARS